MTHFHADVNGHEFSLSVTPTLLGSHLVLDVDDETVAMGHALFFTGSTLETMVDGERVRAEVRLTLFGVQARLFVGSCEVGWGGGPTAGLRIPVANEVTVRSQNRRRRR